MSKATPANTLLNQSLPITEPAEQSGNKRRIGVIGGGQLAGMMAEEAPSLGVELVVQTPKPTDPAVAVASETIFAPIDDAAATAQLANRCEVITFENEFINLEALRPLEQQGVCFRPRLEALAPLLDKYEQRCYLEDIGLPTLRFIALDGEVGKDGFSFQEAIKATTLNQLDFPLVLKARRHGYDGRGTFIVENDEALQDIWKKLDYQSVLLEEFIPFERELAVMAARSSSGEVVVYPVVETQQENQVCRRVIVPADVSPSVVAEIEAIARKLLNQLQVVGIFGIELFLTRSGKVLINEIAPRTHNSGHYTLDACETSQFEQQLRAVAGFPLGSPAMRCGGAVMVNLLGFEHAQDDYLQRRQQLQIAPKTYVHWYGKTASYPGRKLGHVTVLLETASPSQAQVIAQKIESIWYG
jgi:5-(carboxyamino)imidazole ribonucleotide synthase